MSSPLGAGPLCNVGCTIHLHKEGVAVSSAPTGKPIALKQHDNGLWTVTDCILVEGKVAMAYAATYPTDKNCTTADIVAF